MKAAEKNYWPTELEAGGLVWVVQKLIHIVEGSKVIAYTDHKACEAIVKMTSLQTTSPGKLNLRLANWALLLSQYWHNLEVRYVKGIENVLADSLFRLRLEAIALSGETLRASQLHERLDDIEPVYALNVGSSVTATLLELDDEFKKMIIAGYDKDIFFHPIYKAIKEYYVNNKNKVVNMMIARPFAPYHLFLPLNEALLFYKDPVDCRLRLCLPKIAHKEIFALAHDKQNHFGIAKTYDRMVTNYFVPHLLRTLKLYISRCPQCAVNRTLRDKPHRLLKSIESKQIPFHTLLYRCPPPFPTIWPWRRAL